MQHMSVILIAHDIRSLHNVGALFRSADAFGVEKMYLTGITGTPPRKEIAKVALGGETRVAWEYHETIDEVIELLKNEGVKICALELSEKSQSLRSFDVPEQVALILGNEVEGIGPEVLAHVDHVLEIPMLGQKKSLNVSVAAGIALYELCQPQQK